MPIFIKENSELNKNQYPLPKNIEKHLKDTLTQFNQYKTSKGYKRLNSLVNPNYNKRNEKNIVNNKKYISYSDLKRIDHDFRHMDKNPKNIERTLNGGDEMANFVKKTLDNERNKVKETLKQQKTKTRNKNASKPIVKPTKPIKVNENKTIKIFINEKQIIKIKNKINN